MHLLYILIFIHVYRYIPDLICGDLDSARDEVLQYYKSKVIYGFVTCMTEMSLTNHFLYGTSDATTVAFESKVYICVYVGVPDCLFGRSKLH